MNDSDESIIDEVLQGNTEQFALLIKRYEKPIFNLMYRLSGSTEDAADLTQETFLRAYDKLEQFRPGARFFSWLYTIGINLSRDWQRKYKPTQDLDETVLNQRAQSEYDNDRPDLLELKQDVEILHQCLTELPLDYREALILRFQRELQLKEVAEILNISLSGAKMRVRRGLEKLRVIMLEKGHE